MILLKYRSALAGDFGFLRALCFLSREENMKWDKVALLVLDSANEVIKADIPYYTRRYNIPPHLVVKINQPVRQFMFDRRGVNARSELAAMTGVLAGQLTKQSKIIIAAHGSPPPEVTCARLDAVLMSRLLKVLGVSDVGLISFKSCYTGLGDYLDEFTAACTSENIRFGWCLAYINVSGVARFKDEGDVPRYFKRQIVGPLDFFIYHLTCGLGKLLDLFRVKVIKGGLTLPPEFVKTLGPRFNNGMSSSCSATSYSRDASDIFDV
ncbi:hypothetical protein [Enterobacter mori]|uniref:hypothetical protein n=1 Tax=Enterobacter mori TaxID=539813 RepID=UPI003B844A08